MYDDMCVVLPAGELQYSADYVRWLALALQRPGGSPTDDLLRDWGQSNATVTSLFRHLSGMHHYRALSILRDLGEQLNWGKMEDQVEM